MSTLHKLDLMGVTSLAAVTAALLVGWVATTASLPPAQEPVVRDAGVALSAEGRMKLTVTAQPEVAVAARESGRRVAATRTGSGPTLQVSLPIAVAR